ncbi:endo-1,3(4)-beta-glucanase 1 precursor [Dendryphion nanum]|uniref:glucan endo-1,3-beta-D-glucosidase n=1 Tax=Dendryphion nanum TaxID=256645 RepID=A0A9P9DGM5_9PLEO|nr:endo-1,3(4)-beta-glucanase 1 precursor [Dendryphion nanum]
MAKLALMLALANAGLIHALPAPLDVDKRHVSLMSKSLQVTTSYSSALKSSVQTVSITLLPSVTGTIITGLPSKSFTRNPIDAPRPTQTGGSIAPIHSTLAPGTTTPAGKVDPNIFVPMATDAPVKQIPTRADHFVKKEHFVDADDNGPIQTNKFYANFFLGNQTQPVWTHPYSLAWAKGAGNTWGMTVTHVDREKMAWGKETVPRFFGGPVGLQHIVFSAAELGNKTTLILEEPTAFSVFANLLAQKGAAEPLISIPCVQGMGFATAVYNKAKPQLNSGTMFKTLEYDEQLNGITYKYRITLMDGSQWLLYATPVASLGAPPFKLKDSATIEGPKDFIGMIQVAKNPSGVQGEKTFDSTAGAYPVNATISATVTGSTGTYSLSWGKDGVDNQTLAMFALPHQVESFDDKTKARLTNISLITTTKGSARIVVADKFTMVEPDLPNTIGFAPWAKAATGNGGASITDLPADAVKLIVESGALELNQNFTRQTSLDSMYYSGKGLAKFAGIIYTLQTIGKKTELAAAGLVKLKDAFNVFVNNTQPLPLVYDSVWKGVVSSGTYAKKDPGLDFGNTLYNDHHFHYGYFVWAAAVIGHLDPKWLTEGTNKAWVNTLVRDFANPISTDPFFPFQRSFDWYHGHSWAKGLFESGDGKDQESSSEDTFSTYALKMWGKISGDANMEARGNLQLAVQARSVRNYFLLSKDNKVQPEKFIPNKVTGILFENKIDHTTYFGANPEYIQGIHMIPLNPSTAYTRSKTFIKEEWDAYFSNGRADKVVGGWRGILYANLACIDPEAAWKFFADPKFDVTTMLDGGASRTWYLAYTAAMRAGVAAKVKSVMPGTGGNAEVGIKSESGELSDVEARESDEEWEWNEEEEEMEGDGDEEELAGDVNEEKEEEFSDVETRDSDEFEGEWEEWDGEEVEQELNGEENMEEFDGDQDGEDVE